MIEEMIQLDAVSTLNAWFTQEEIALMTVYTPKDSNEL